MRIAQLLTIAAIVPALAATRAGAQQPGVPLSGVDGAARARDRGLDRRDDALINRDRRLERRDDRATRHDAIVDRRLDRDVRRDRHDLRHDRHVPTP